MIKNNQSIISLLFLIALVKSLICY